MLSITDQIYSQLFLEARELPATLQMVQDSRMRVADPNDEAFRRCEGLRSGLVAWQGQIGAMIERVVDIRWVFPNEEKAKLYHQQTLQVNSENMPYLQNVPTIGMDCYVFGGKVDFGIANVTSYIYLFRVQSVVVKFYVAQGEGQNLPISSVASLAQNAFNRVTNILANLALSPMQNPMQNPTPPIQNPYQQGYQNQQQTYQQGYQQGYQQPQGGFAAGQQFYQQGQQGQALYPISQQTTAIQYNQTMPTNFQQPSSALAVLIAVLGSLQWLVSIPFYIVFMMLASGEYVNSGDEEVMVVSGILSFLLAIPNGIMTLIWLYKTWDAVPQQFRNTSPGQAIGFLFIPFFNLYWMFRAIPGLSKAIQATRRAINPAYSGGSGFVAGLIGCIMCFIPFLQMFSFIPFLVWLLQTNSSKNKMLMEQQMQQQNMRQSGMPNPMRY